ncbi:MAG: SemiSWEET family transporter [Candidatus Saccharimonadaceae bacterium]
MNIEVIGYLAGGMIAISLLPQIVKSWKTKSTNDLSLSWGLISVAGQILWLIYGLGISSQSLVVMSSITLTMAVIMLVMKITYENQKKS